MATQIQQLRGTAAELDAFTGNPGVITVDETNKTIRLHDGVTLGGNPIRSGNEVAMRAELKALSVSSAKTAYLTEEGREGQFIWRAGDFSAEVAADTDEGIYIAPDSAPTGASGAWVRQHRDYFEPRFTGGESDLGYQDGIYMNRSSSDGQAGNGNKFNYHSLIVRQCGRIAA